MSEADAVLRSKRPVTVELLTAKLRELDVAPGDVLLVHSSLRSLGWVCGGAGAVIAALRDVIGPSGTLVMPTHSANLSEPSNWVNPPVPKSWFAEIRRTMPAFDARRTPTRMMGAIPELFRTWPGVLRSDHPTSSFAAAGPHAEYLVELQPLEDPMGDRSPIGRVYELDGKVLLLGVGYDKNTSLHLAERRAFGMRHRRVRTGSPVHADGQRRWTHYDEPRACADDFNALGEAFDANRDVFRTDCGRLMRQRQLVDFGADWLAQHRLPDGSCTVPPGSPVK